MPGSLWSSGAGEAYSVLPIYPHESVSILRPKRDSTHKQPIYAERGYLEEFLLSKGLDEEVFTVVANLA